MSKILAIKAQTSKTGRPLIILDTVERTHFVAYGMWTNKGLSENLEAYVGGEFDGSYFQKGDTLLNGAEVKDDNVILEDFSAQMHPGVLAGVVAAENAAKASKFNDAALLFRRRRNEALAAAKAATPASPAEA